VSTLKQGLTVSLLTLCSRILGFVREAVAAQLFGASGTTDSFYAVFRLPNVLRQILADGAFSLALVPMLHQARAAGGPTEAAALAGRVLGLLLLLLLPLSLLGLLLAPQLLHWLLPGTADAAAALQMWWWTLPYVLLVGLLGWSAALLHAHDRFAAPALTPLLLSLSMIALPLAFAEQFQPPVLSLAIAVLVGGLLQLLWQGGALWRIRLVPFPRPSLDVPQGQLRRLAAVLLPSLMAAATLQLLLLIETFFAARAGAGSVSWLYLAERIVQFPQGVIGTAISVVLVQRLAALHAGNQTRTANHVLDRAIRLVLLLGTLCAMGGWYLAEPITWALYGYGAFTAHDVQKTAAAVAIMALGSPAILLVRALGAACLATRSLRLLLLASMLALSASLLANLLCLHAADMGPGAHLRLAAISAGAAWLCAISLCLGLWRDGAWRITVEFWAFVLRVAVAATLCALTLQAVGESSWLALEAQPVQQRLWRLASALSAAVLVHFGCAWLLGLRYRHLS
jgi:putative peptidoglycan lipid II flippase